MNDNDNRRENAPQTPNPAQNTPQADTPQTPNPEQNTPQADTPQTTTPATNPLGNNAYLASGNSWTWCEKVATEPIPSTPADGIFAVLTMICAYLFTVLIVPIELGMGVTLFTVLFVALVLGYAKAKQIKVSRRSYVPLGLVLLSGLNFSIFANQTLAFCNLLFLMTCAVYWVSCCFGTRLEERVGQYFSSDLQNQIFKIPFGNFACAPKVLVTQATANAKGRTFLSVGAGLVVAVPLVLIIVPLLMQADLTFWHLVENMARNLGNEFSEFLLRFPVALLVGLYLFGLLYGNLQKRSTDRLTPEKVQHFRTKTKVLPLAMVVTLMVVLCGLYFVFFGAQANTMFAALRGTRPEDITYAEYARNGFFELCTVSAINLGVLWGVHLFAARKQDEMPRILKALNVILVGQTLVLVVTALSRMLLYIGQYGLTPLRAYTTWFMILLFLVFAFTGLNYFKKFNLCKCLVVTFCVCFMVLCYSNIEGVIVRYNMARYLDGTLEDARFEMIYQMEEVATLYYLDVWESTDDPALRMEISNICYVPLYEKPFARCNLQQLYALHTSRGYHLQNSRPGAPGGL